VGQSFTVEEGEDVDVVYVAGEPGILAGATIGYAYEQRLGSAFMSGAWLGLPVYELQRDASYDERPLGMQPTLSLALGYRHGHGHEFYLTPKLYLIEEVRFWH
jgi:hypothetical protein